MTSKGELASGVPALEEGYAGERLSFKTAYRQFYECEMAVRNDDILRLLVRNPQGLTSTQAAPLLGCNTKTASYRLSRLAMYGVINRDGDHWDWRHRRKAYVYTVKSK